MLDHTAPKINQKLIRRGIILAVILAAIGGTYAWLLSVKDLDEAFGGSFESIGDVAAIETKSDGSVAVIIKPDGTVTPAPDYHDGDADRDIAWKPDGSRLFFVSDRYKKNGDTREPHVFRWNPAKNNVDRRTLDSRGKGALSFTVCAGEEPSRTALMLAGGEVLEFNPANGDSKPVLPPRKKESSQAQGRGEEGGRSAFEEAYAELGTSFVSARWCKDKKYIAAVLRRENGGQLLMVQDAAGTKRPVIVGAADHVGLDIDPKTGKIVYSLIGFQFVDTDPAKLAPFLKNGKIVPPFLNYIGIFDPETELGTAIGTTDSYDVAFGSPAVAPDGDRLVVPVGPYKNKVFIPNQLAIIPMQQGGAQSPQHLTPGLVGQASWDPTGKKVVFLEVQKDGKRSVCVINSDGSNFQNLTKDTGDFSDPGFSPQVKPAGS